MGRIVRSCCILGGYDITTGECFFVQIENKTEELLVFFIRNFVRSSTLIVADCHASYRNLNIYG
ncbi:hypothetical protein H312_00837 [Anncaliia algerae PRA339]|uniref:ISXO2-like transposase domain-containing protein n=1 Tax=Anncaliia algerae PRA339 TaxID=1288291 RepID=A0A059F3U8_9MICR|nr:hypothetical protein H312_00837 [Anncaliia algerae PRA339]